MGYNYNNRRWMKAHKIRFRTYRRTMNKDFDRFPKTKKCIREFYKKVPCTNTWPYGIEPVLRRTNHGSRVDRSLFAITGNYPGTTKVQLKMDYTGSLTIRQILSCDGMRKVYDIIVFPNGMVTSTIAELDARGNMVKYLPYDFAEAIKSALHDAVGFSDKYLHEEVSKVLKMLKWYGDVIGTHAFTYCNMERMAWPSKMARSYPGCYDLT